MGLVERVKAILQKPKEEWPKIEADTESLGTLFWGYAAPLALVPPVAGFIGAVFTGYVGLRANPVASLEKAIAAYLLSLVAVLVMAFIINALAGMFGAQKNFSNAMKVSIHAPTAFWLAGIFAIQPPLAFLSLLGLYSYYLYYTGIAALMKPPAEKALSYTIAAFAAFLVLAGLLVAAAALFIIQF